jgi:hypothetical protein
MCLLLLSLLCIILLCVLYDMAEGIISFCFVKRSRKCYANFWIFFFYFVFVNSICYFMSCLWNFEELSVKMLIDKEDGTCISYNFFWKSRWWYIWTACKNRADNWSCDHYIQVYSSHLTLTLLNLYLLLEGSYGLFYLTMKVVTYCQNLMIKRQR